MVVRELLVHLDSTAASGRRLDLALALAAHGCPVYFLDNVHSVDSTRV
jgi:hypothetical protein